MNVTLSAAQFNILELLLDAVLELNDINVNDQKHEMILKVERIYYEEPKEKKFLLFNSKVYRNIETEIIIRNINKVERINKDMNNKHPVSRDPIVYFGMKNDQLVIETTYKEILRMDINSSTQIKIHDISDPSKEYLTIVSNDETGFSKIAILIENVKKLQS